MPAAWHGYVIAQNHFGFQVLGCRPLSTWHCANSIPVILAGMVMEFTMRKKIIALLLVAAATPTLVMAGDKHGSDCCPKGSHGHFEAGPQGPVRDFAGGPGLLGIDLNRDQRKAVREADRDEHLAVSKINRDYLDKLSEADKAAMKGAIQTARSDSEGKVRMALNADQIKQFDANLKREADQRAEWEEFQKWKAAKKG